jgi:Ca2+/Na+ antiporter
VKIARSFGVNDAFISLTLIACGTSLPELAASVAAAVKKNTQMALGNIVGSNIFNITLILGLSSQVMPLTSAGITIIDYIVMIAAAILPMLFAFKKCLVFLLKVCQNLLCFHQRYVIIVPLLNRNATMTYFASEGGTYFGKKSQAYSNENGDH